MPCGCKNPAALQRSKLDTPLLAAGFLIFGKLVKKHTARINAYLEERHFFLKFFDRKAFATMAVMMAGGVGLRASGLAPGRFIAVFYTGLGASLLVAGLLFGRNYGRAVFAMAAAQNKT